jgi:hypothetical protein
MSGDEDEIAKWLQKKGTTKCPPRAARELGETSPGWRRAERRAERAQSDRLRKRQQQALQVRAGFSGEDGEKAKR